VNKSEKEVVKKYVEKGYKYLHSGWPDFVFFKVDENGNIIKESIRFVEVKLRGDGLRYEQGVMEKIFKSLDLPFSIEFVDSNPNQSSPDHSNPTQSIPVQTKPSQTTPDQSNPFHTTPSHHNPNQSNPAQAIPHHANPTQPSPIQTKPFQRR
jgi:hypothetical protein